MKPDKPAKERDILRAHCAKSLKASSQPEASSSASSSSSSGSEASSSSESPGVPPGESPGSEEGRGAEMRLYLDKLRELVPNVPRTGKLSRVRLIHSAIDYITDLQEALEARTRRKLRDKQGQPPRPPLAALPPAQVETNSQRGSPLSETTANRLQPSTSGRQPPPPSAAMEVGYQAPLPLGSASTSSANVIAHRVIGSSGRNSSSSSGGNRSSSVGGSSSSSGNSSVGGSSSKAWGPLLPSAPGPPQDPC